MKKKSTLRSAFSTLRVLTALLLFAAAVSFALTRPLLAFLRPESPAKISDPAAGELTFAQRIAYQRAIDEVYWRHRIWPKERPDPKPALDRVMSRADLEKKVTDYLRKSQALEDYWQRPITAEQLQAEMDRMAKRTKQPEVLRELFAALGDDPFVVAECLARPVLAERLLTNWYAYDQRIHGELKQRAEAELQAHRTLQQINQLSGKYSEIELLKSDNAGEIAGQAHRLSNGQLAAGAPALQRQDSTCTVKLSSREWNEAVQKLATMFSDKPVAAGVSPAKDASIAQIKTGILSRLQEDETRYYATAVIEKAEDRLKLATVSWSKEPSESWLARAETDVTKATTATDLNYALPEIPTGGCIDDTWTATAGPPEGRIDHTAVWTGSEMIVWGGEIPYVTRFATGSRYNPSTHSWSATSIINAPDGRVRHTAVWTGNEMIVWGGDGDSGAVNTGRRYSPMTNSWTATSTTNAPSARDSHSAVWAGNEMIVWGGYFYDGSNHYLSTGGRYNPSSDSWTPTNTTSAPSGRDSHTAVWAGNEMIVWGGYFYDGSDHYLNTGGQYNPSTNSWTAVATTDAPAGRVLHTVVWSGSEMIVWGGYFYSGGAHFLNTGGRYNPSTNSWITTSTTNAPTARLGHTATWTGVEMIVWGGSAGPFVETFNTGGRYNPSTNGWTATGTTNAPSGRSGHTAVWIGTEMIVWGGVYGDGFSVVNYLNSGGRYNPTTDSWMDTDPSNVPSRRFFHTAVWTGSEMIVWGGADDATGGMYRPSTDTWVATTTSGAPAARSTHTAVWTGGEMIVWGGDFFDGKIEQYFNTGGRYNPGTNNWTATSTANAPAARAHHTAVWTGHEMVVWGGFDDSGDLDTGGRYNPGTDTWTPTTTANAPSVRDSHTAVWTGSEMIIWGGDGESGELNTGGRYNPSSNSWITTTLADAPSARYLHAAVWTGSEMIVWGGFAVYLDLDTGGRYNPITESWTATNTINAPEERESHTAVWTGSEMIVWGGYDTTYNTDLETGAKYNPGTNNWTVTSTINAPPPRAYQTAVWTGNEMIIWGGLDGNFSDLNTGWRYCAQSGPSPTPTPTPTPCTGRCPPTPRPRPTPPPRP